MDTKHWLWWAVDQDGVVLDILVQSRRAQAFQTWAAVTGVAKAA
jgi:transposase-like protein